MADHVKRLVTGWFDTTTARAPVDTRTDVLTPLVDGIYRLIREAEARTRDSCIAALPGDIDTRTRNHVVDAIFTLERQGKLGRRTRREH